MQIQQTNNEILSSYNRLVAAEQESANKRYLLISNCLQSEPHSNIESHIDCIKLYEQYVGFAALVQNEAAILHKLIENKIMNAKDQDISINDPPKSESNSESQSHPISMNSVRVIMMIISN